MELRESIIRFFSTATSTALPPPAFARKGWFLGRWITHGDWYPDRVLRLFRRESGKWAGTAEHCAVEVHGECTTLAGDLLHYSNPDISSYVGKINYFADLHLQRQLAQKARWSTLRRRSFARGGVLCALTLFALDYWMVTLAFFIAASAAYSTLVRHSRFFEHLQSRQPVCAPPKSP